MPPNSLLASSLQTSSRTTDQVAKLAARYEACLKNKSQVLVVVAVIAVRAGVPAIDRRVAAPVAITIASIDSRPVAIEVGVMPIVMSVAMPVVVAPILA